MLEQLIVGLIVGAAALHAARKYVPARWREQMVYWLAARGANQARMARLLNTVAGCGSGCGSCGSCAEPAPESDAPRVIKLHPRR